jgi:Rv2632c-like
MTTAKRWHVEIFLDEHEDERRTRAEARLHTDDNTHLTGVGTARRNPDDVEIPEIGDEVAAARALFALGHELLLAAASDIQATTHEKTNLHT